VVLEVVRGGGDNAERCGQVVDIGYIFCPRSDEGCGNLRVYDLMLRSNHIDRTRSDVWRFRLPAETSGHELEGPGSSLMGLEDHENRRLVCEV
jgi:hypothetical protein